MKYTTIISKMHRIMPHHVPSTNIRRGVSFLRITGPLCILAVMAGMSSCRKDLCYNHDEHSLGYRTKVVSLWEQEWERDHGMQWADTWDATAMNMEYDDLRPDLATGLAVVVYREEETEPDTKPSTDTRATMENEYHLDPEGGQIYTGEESRSLLFYNDDTQYIVFSDMATLPSASATTRTRSRSTYSMSATHADERTVTPPDMLYGAFIEDYQAEFQLGWQELPVTLRPLTYTYLIRFEFDAGLKYVELARGALAGMAENVFLQDGHTGPETATILFDETNCSITDYGVEAHVLSFGAPNFNDEHYSPGRSGTTDGQYGLQLEVRLANGKIVTRDFDISDQMAKQPRGGVIIVKGITISDEEGMEGGSGFDVDVDGWGEHEDIDMPL